MKKAIRTLAGAVLVLALLSVLIGCGKSSANTPTGPVKDTIIITQNEEPTGLFSQNSKYPSSANKDHLYQEQVYDSLLYLNSDNVLELNLAKDYEISPDGLVYTFYLRDDVYFHNGDKMTAEDVAFTYNLAMETYNSLAITMFANFNHAEVVDEYTVNLILDAPFASFDRATSARLGYIISKKEYERIGPEGYIKAPIGTGPYKFVSKVSGDSITLVANELYFNGPPPIKNLIIKPITNISTQFLSLENGELDVIVRADVSSCLQITNPNITWSSTSSSARTMLQLIARNPSPCADINLRRAIQCAIDRDEILLGACEGYGKPLYVDTLLDYAGAPDEKDLVIVPTNVEQAKQYVAASTYRGQPLKLMCVSGGTEERIAQIIQGQLKNVGINVEIMPVDSATRATLNRSGEGIDMHIDTSISSNMDIGSLATQYRTVDVRVPQWSRELCDKFDRLLRASDTEINPEKRKEYNRELLNTNTEEALIVPLICPVVAIAYNANLKDVSAHMNGCFAVDRWSW